MTIQVQKLNTLLKNSQSIVISDVEVYRQGEYIYCTGFVSNFSNETEWYIGVGVTYYDFEKTALKADWISPLDSEGIGVGEKNSLK